MKVRWSEVAALAACVAVFVLLCAWRCGDHTHPYFDDVGFLDLGNGIRELGGLRALLHALFDGTWTEDNRNPLYPALLSFVAGRDPGYHTRAQALNVVVGALALLSWWWVLRKRLGVLPALMTAAFLAMSETLVDYSSREASEPLLLVFWAFAFDAILAGPRWYWLAGIFAGLAQLTKGSGIFLVACLAVTLLVHRGLRAAADLRAWAMPAGFTLAAWPLLVRNLVVYGSPFHHWNNKLLWNNRLPDYAEIYAPGGLAQLSHGFGAWLRTTTLHDLLVRIGMGICEVALHTADAMTLVAPAPLGRFHIPQLFVGFGLFVLALVFLWRSERSVLRTFLLVHTALFLVFFVNMAAIGGSSRYMIPMVIPLVAVLAAHVNLGVWAPRWLAFATLCVVTSVTLDPSPRRLPPGFAEAEGWLVTHVRPGEAYAVDSRSHLEPEWRMPQGTRMEIVSSTWQRQAVPAQQLIAEFHRLGVRYVVVDASSNKDGAPRWFFHDQIPADLSRVPPGLEVAYRGPGYLILTL
jgi:hypothetical protein